MEERRTLASLRIALTLIVLGGAAANADRVAVGQLRESEDAALASPRQPSHLASLIRQLGDDEFAARERAADELIRIGMDAKPALLTGLRASDREVRYRCERILMIVNEMGFRARLDAFLNDRNETNGHGLPGWDYFRSSVGDGPEARRLFADMQRSEPELMSSLEANPAEAAQAISERTIEIRAAMSTPVQRVMPSVESTAAIVFVSGFPEVRIDTNLKSQVYTLCYQSPFRSDILSGPRSDSLKKVLSTLISREEGTGDSNAYQGIMLAIQYELKAGVVPAVKVLEMDGGIPPHMKLYSLLAIAKFGDVGHVSLLDQHLADKTAYGGKQKIANVEYETQLRDVALAVQCHLLGEDPRDHGFEIVRPHNQFMYDPVTLGFASETARDKAFQNWAEFRKKRSEDRDEAP